MKRRILTFLIALSLLAPIAAYQSHADNETESASTQPAAGTSDGKVDAREESVYALLLPDGTIDGAYVVNRITTGKPGGITDYGEYASVKNLTDTTKLTSENGKVTLTASGDTFTYQGTLKSLEMPWIINISYTLDGIETDAEDIAGKSGVIKSVISTRKNPNADTAFFENYMLQISVALDTALCRDITSETAQIANAGGDKRLTFTVFPGTETSSAWSANVTNFEMQAIEIAAVPYSMNIELPDMSGLLEGFDELTAAVTEIAGGAETISNSTGAFSGGMQEFRTGIGGFGDGLNSLAAQNSLLTEGGDSILSMMENYAADNKSMDTVTLFVALQQYVAGIYSYTMALQQLVQAFVEIDEAAQGLLTGADGLKTGTSELSKGLAELKSGVESLPGQVNEKIASLTSTFTGGEFTARSFADERNENTGYVQFIFRTKPVTIPEVNRTDDAGETAQRTFIDKLIDLFR